jgi:DNA polymerase III subunit chi
MTSIDFYSHVTDRLEVAAKLVAKAFAQHGSVRVLTPDATTTEALDRWLWLRPPIAFLPHCRLASPLAAETPIWIDHLVEHPGDHSDHACVLINMQAEPPPFFARFERLAEIVGIEQTDVVAGRARYRFYRERGYELRTHKLAEL